MTNFPLHIKFLSDSTEIKFSREIKEKGKDVLGEYEFTKVHKKLPHHKGQKLTMSLQQIQTLKSDNLIEIKTAK